MTRVVVEFVLIWIGFGVAGAGFQFAYFHGEFPSPTNWRDDLGIALLWGCVLGPIGLLMSFFLSGFGRHGWRLRPKRKRTAEPL